MHWTKRPENKEKLRLALKRAAKARHGVTKKKAKTRTIHVGDPMTNDEFKRVAIASTRARQRTSMIPEHELLEALRGAGFESAAAFIQGWIARG